VSMAASIIQRFSPSLCQLVPHGQRMGSFESKRGAVWKSSPCLSKLRLAFVHFFPLFAKPWHYYGWYLPDLLWDTYNTAGRLQALVASNPRVRSVSRGRGGRTVLGFGGRGLTFFSGSLESAGTIRLLHMTFDPNFDSHCKILKQLMRRR